MTTTVTDALTGIIMRADGPEPLPAVELAEHLLGTMPPFFVNQRGAEFIDFAVRTDPKRDLDECCLAELIAAEFRLDEVG